MQIRRIAIRDFRKIARRDIAELADGLNIVVGDNEAGKSTMLAALRAAFFERHRVGGDVAKSMLPYGSAVRPTVAVDFELDGKPWSLVKAFCQRPEASLQGPGERHVGDAVEDRLAELFGFTPPGRGASKPDEHHGTHGLLWVEQGMRPNLGIGSGGRDTLAAALEREVGQVTGGERGRALLAAAEERRERFWDKRDRPRGPVVDARRRLEEREGEQAALQVAQRDYEARLNRLEALGVLLERHRRDDHLGRATAAVVAARRDLDRAAQSRLAHDAAVAACHDAERNVADARERRDRRRALAEKREAARLAAERASAAASEAAVLARQRVTARSEAETRLDVARTRQRHADDHVRACLAARQRQSAEAFLADQSAKLAAAEEQAEKRREALSRAEILKIDPEAIAALTALERAVDRADAELEAASVQIAFVPDGARRVQVDGVEHPPGQPLGLSRDAELELEGFGRLRLRPGGGAELLARKADEAARALREALARSGAASLSDARQKLQARSEAQAEAAAADATLKILAPAGLDVLRQSISDARTRLRQTEDVTAEPVDDHALARAQALCDEAGTAAEAAERHARAAAAAHQQAATEAATLAERRENALRHVEALSDELSAARNLADDDLLAGRLAAAEGRHVAAQAVADTAAAAFASTDADTVQLTLGRAERAEAEVRRDLAALEGEQRDLRVELRALGQSGIGERLDELSGEIAVERTRVGSLEREAAASRLLHETLFAAQRESKERWLGPVRARVAPYLRLIHPESEIRMDDRTLEIEGLYRDGILEEFGALSMGAREQVAVVTRLALADILRASGHPAAVILDDALVNTDDARLDRMRNVLARAARNLQILIFTCRERDFLGLGATHRI